MALQINFDVKAATVADAQAKATAIASAFFGNMTGVTLKVGGAPIVPDTYNADGTVALWVIGVEADK